MMRLSHRAYYGSNGLFAAMEYSLAHAAGWKYEIPPDVRGNIDVEWGFHVEQDALFAMRTGTYLTPEMMPKDPLLLIVWHEPEEGIIPAFAVPALAARIAELRDPALAVARREFPNWFEKREFDKEPPLPGALDRLIAGLSLAAKRNEKITFS